jgi:hypothetical protein
MALDVHEVADSDNDFLNLLSKLTGRCKDQSLAGFQVLVYLLEDRDREGGSFASSRLSLCNDIRSCIILSVSGNSERECSQIVPFMTGIIARCWIADGRSKP